MKDSLKNLRSIAKALRSLCKTLKSERRQLAQTVAGVADVEMVSARCEFALRQLQTAERLLTLLEDDIDTPVAPISIEPFSTDWRGHDARQPREE